MPPSFTATFLDRDPIRGLTLLLPQGRIRGFGRPISPRVIHSGERSRGACRAGWSRRPGCGRAEWGRSRRRLFGGQFRLLHSGLEHSPGDPHTVHIAASLRATATRARLAPDGVRWQCPTRGASRAGGSVSSAPMPPHRADGGVCDRPPY
jgi:hypothetical protein